MSELAHLFSPIKIGNVEIQNRTLQSARILNLKKKGVKRVSDCKGKKEKPGEVTTRQLFTQEETQEKNPNKEYSLWRLELSR